MNGKKTYIIAILAGISTTLNFLNILPHGLYQTIMGFLGAGGLITLRSAIENLAGSDPQDLAGSTPKMIKK